MTIIVYRDGVLAADDLLSDMPDGLFCGRTVKLAYRKKDRCIIAGCGAASGMTAFIKAALKGKQALLKCAESYTGIIARPDGVVEEWTNGMCAEIRCDYFAIGWGTGVANGAMAAGVDALSAARIVCGSYGWPAEIHTMDHDGTFTVHEQVTLPLHESARITAAELERKPARKTRRPRPRSNRRKTKQTRRTKH